MAVHFEPEPGHGEVEAVVVGCHLFDDVGAMALADIMGSFSGIRLHAGEILMHQGDPAEALYLVRHGRLRTTVSHGEESVVTGEVGRHEVVGEMALLTDDRRSATVEAVRDTELYALPADVFLELVSQHPSMLRPFARVVVERHRSAFVRRRADALPATLVVLPAPGVDVAWFVETLVRGLIGFTVETVWPVDAVGRTDPARWLLDIENRVDISVLVADGEPTQWTKQCLRHGDRVLLVADDRLPPALTPVEVDPDCAKRLTERRLDLVMLYDTAARSSRWTADRAVHRRHNIRAGNLDDVARMTRILTGTGNVVVLGGGGARGFAHIGVIERLLAEGIAIDAVVGTSAGALVGGIFACHGDVTTMTDDLIGWFSDVRWRRDFSLPIAALLTGRQMSDGLAKLYDGRDIEDLVVDYAAVSTNLTTGSLHIHTSGPLWQAVRASAAVPGIFPAVSHHGQVLVDGGLLSNLPVPTALDRHRGARIIAVDVGGPTGLGDATAPGDGVMRRRSIFRGESGHPNISRVLMRLTELGRTGEQRDLIDILIEPDVSAVGLIDTSKAPIAIEAGRRAAAEAITAGAFA